MSDKELLDKIISLTENVVKLKIENERLKFENEWGTFPWGEDCVEYTRTDALIDKVINFLNYKLDDGVATRVPSTIIPHYVAKSKQVMRLCRIKKEIVI